MRYADLTIRDRNPVKRWLQTRRYAQAIAIARDLCAGTSPSVLDFGAGDGELFRQRGGFAVSGWHAYEPAESLRSQARELSGSDEGFTLVADADALPPAAFDLAFCLEVFEHLPPAETDIALGLIATALKPGGRAIIGVPVEIGPPALAKGFFRMTRRRGDFDARLANILAAAAGRPPQDRPRALLEGLPYFPHHLGFDHRSLRQRLSVVFDVERTIFGPFAAAGPAVATEVHFVVRKPELAAARPVR